MGKEDPLQVERQVLDAIRSVPSEKLEEKLYLFVTLLRSICQTHGMSVPASDGYILDLLRIR